MSDLIDQQNQEADVALKAMEHVLKLSSKIEVEYCYDDEAAQVLGWPRKSAHDAVIRRIIENGSEKLREEIVLTPSAAVKPSKKIIN
tara:strand:+ start:125 stop:385 length:261 start_codon:yes stop_codon:yes gene_type:complete